MFCIHFLRTIAFFGEEQFFTLASHWACKCKGEIGPVAVPFAWISHFQNLKKKVKVESEKTGVSEKFWVFFPEKVSVKQRSNNNASPGFFIQCTDGHSHRTVGAG